MSQERPQPQEVYDTLHARIVRKAHEHAYRLGGDPEIIDRVVPGLVTSVLDACEAGLSREDVVKAVAEGLHQGELQCADQSLTADFWEAVRVDAATYSARRYDPQAKEDW